MEEHESDLLDRLLTEVQQGIPGGASVGEAMAEMRRALFEAPESRELATRVITLMFGGQGYLRRTLRPDGGEPAGANDVYRAVVGPDHDLQKKELSLLKRLSDEINARLPDGLSEEERMIRGQELVDADPELTALVAELEELAELRDGPPMWRHLSELDEEDGGDSSCL